MTEVETMRNQVVESLMINKLPLHPTVGLGRSLVLLPIKSPVLAVNSNLLSKKM